MAERAHGLVAAEAASAPTVELPQIYPKLVLTYEFARLLRGEGFAGSRPEGVDPAPLYRLEAETERTLSEVRARMPLELRDAAAFHVRDMCRRFELPQ